MCKIKEMNIMEHINIKTGEKLDLDRVSKLKDNALLKHRPELWCEWDFEKNNELGLDIWEITYGSGKKVYWQCYFGHSFNSKIVQRLYGSDCKFCTMTLPKDIKYSLYHINPKLASQWHPTKNGNLTSKNITANSSKKVWWLGECGHEWEANINNRSNGSGCPYCNSHRPLLLVGFNDMWTTNPELAKLLANPEDGYKYTQCSNKKVDWKCPDCGEIIKDKQINQIYRYSLSCSRCSDGVSYPEKFVYNLMFQLNIKFKRQKQFAWSQDRKYDFYIPSLDVIIETHGIQHYEKSNRGRNLQEEQANDKYKYELAIQNGIKPENYVIIDARRSELEWVKNSILNSYLAELFDLSNVNWIEIHKKSVNSLMKVACDLWNSGIRSTIEIGRLMKIGRATILKYLKQGTKIDWCEYCPKEVKMIKGIESGKRSGKAIIQMNLDGEYIRNWESMSIASKSLGIGNGRISACCTGKQKTAGGYKWMLKEDCEKLNIS